MGDEPRGRRLAVHAGDRHQRNAAVLAIGKHGVDDRLAHRPRPARRRLQVHPQARAGVHFDHDPALVFQRTGDVQGNDVDAGHVQADHLGRFDRAGGHFGMDQIGHVGRRAAGAQIRSCGG